MNVKTFLLGSVIFVAGVVSGYFGCKTKLEKQYREKYKEESASLREYYAQLNNDIDSDDDSPEEEFEEPEDDPDEDTDAEDKISEGVASDEETAEYVNNLINKMGYAKSKNENRVLINYNKPDIDEVAKRLKETLEKSKHAGNRVFEDMTADLEEYDDDTEDPENVDLEYEAELEQLADEQAKLVAEHKKNKEPYVITSEEYKEHVPGYSHQSLYYYSDDRVLCEDDDAVVDDEEAVVGLDYEDVLEMQTTAWVRNDRLSAMYEIHKIPKSYNIDVLNNIETPREREFRIQGRRKEAMDD